MRRADLLPDIIYHYTSLEVLQALLANIREINGERCFVFHASKINCMNDPSEFLHGYKILWKTLERMEANGTERRYKLTSIWDNIGKNQEECEKMLIDNIYEKDQAPYVICFSKQKDSLPLWNMYAAYASGVNLGFISDKVTLEFDEESHVKDVNVEHFLPVIDVEYSTLAFDMHENLIRNMYDNYMKEIVATAPTEMLKVKVNHLSLMSLATAPYIKTPAYHFEDEARLYHYLTQDEKVLHKFTPAGTCKPYIQIPIPVRSLSSVTLGPCCNQAALTELLRRELDELALSPVQLYSSSIAYRNI